MVRIGNLVHKGLEPIRFKEGGFIALRAEAQPLTMLAMFHGEGTAQRFCPYGNLKVHLFL